MTMPQQMYVYIYMYLNMIKLVGTSAEHKIHDGARQEPCTGINTLLRL